MRTRPLLTDLAIFMAFVALTTVMTWPWALHLRDAVSDRGDAYAIVYWLWWDYHQTFNDPANLFQATVFYPYQYTMAFTENSYGVALLFFPLFALGFRPMTVHSVATFMAFVFAGYGMFRLARTLSGSNSVAWIAALVFAFVPYHFQRLPHLHLLFTGWIPLLLESVVLFARQRTWRRALWMAVAFTMNALTAITWFVLVLVPLAISAVFLVTWYQLWRDRAFWLRTGVAAAVAAAVLMPFLVPYYYVHSLYGFVRSPEDVNRLSAYPIHWLAASGRNKLWAGLGGKAAIDEFTLFPGFLPPLLMLAAFFLIKPLNGNSSHRLQSIFEGMRVPFTARRVVVVLDVLALALLLIVLLTIGYGGFNFRISGYELFRSNHLTRPLLYFFVVVIVRLIIAVPEWIQRIRKPKLLTRSLRDNSSTVLLALAAIWALTGFLGSFGMHFAFHRTLYRFAPIFASLRAPVRWAMICYVGLALFAGFGAKQFAELIQRWMPRLPRALPYICIGVLVMFEQRVAPIEFVRGEADPDAVSQRLRNTQMRGGVVELPAERDHYAYYRYMLRAADHGRPIVTASASFAPPIVQELESFTAARPIPDAFLDLLERIPTSYLVVHNRELRPDSRAAIEGLLERAESAGRIRFINSYGSPLTPDDLYAITKNEPDAKTETKRANADYAFVFQQYYDLLRRPPTPAELQDWNTRLAECQGEPLCGRDRRASKVIDLLQDREFDRTAALIYRLYRVGLGRPPTYAEWDRDRNSLGIADEGKTSTFIDEWISRPEFLDRYPTSLSSRQYVEKLLRTAGVESAGTRAKLIDGLDRGTLTRAKVLLEALNNPPHGRQTPEEYVALCYFIFLKREPDSQGYGYWLDIVRNHPKGKAAAINGFIYADEYYRRLSRP